MRSKYYFELIKSRMLTIRIELRWLLFLAVIYLSLYEFWFVKINEPYYFQWWSELGSIFIKLCYSYLAAFVFFFFAVHLPKERRKHKLFRYINNKTLTISFELNGIFYDLAACIGDKMNHERILQLTRSDIAAMLLKVNMSSPVINTHGNFHNWHDYLQWKRKRIINEIKNLIPFNDLLSAELVQYLTDIEENFSRLDPHNNMQVTANRSIIQFAIENLPLFSRRMVDNLRKSVNKRYEYLYQYEERTIYHNYTSANKSS